MAGNTSLRALVCVLACACVVLSACATNDAGSYASANATSTASRVAWSPVPTAQPPTVTPWPAPKAWTHFTYLPTRIFSVEYPTGWIMGPPIVDGVIELDSMPENGPPPPGRSAVHVTVQASTNPSDIARLCPRHPSGTVAGLPAALSTHPDNLGEPVYEWDAANQAVALRFLFEVNVGSLDDYQVIYPHMLASLSVAPQYAHAPACVPA
jgi:hypothetical protein